jgi:hypothetical protein
VPLILLRKGKISAPSTQDYGKKVLDIAGSVFGIASVVMLISTITQLHGYYFKDIGGDDEETLCPQ